MSLLVITLMLAAAVLHASWHVMVKFHADRLTMLCGMNVVSAAVALAALPFTTLPRAEVWPVLALAVLLHFAYVIMLPVLYKQADIGQAYPVARGMTPLVAAAIAFFVLGESLTVDQVTAGGTVCAGLLIITWNRGLLRVSPRLLSSAMMVGCLVAAYSVVDGYGTRLNGDWLGFTAWLILLTTAVLVPYATAVNGTTMWGVLVREWRRTLTSGFLGVVAFGVFLWALSLGAVGPVAALRETSILFTTLLGAVFLKEHLSPTRLAGAAVVMTGVGLFAAAPGA